MNDELLPQSEPQPSSQRWLVLGIFSLSTLLNCNAWIMFAPISSIVQDQYGVSAFAVDSLSMVFMGTYILFAIPALRVMENSGLRGGILVGMALTSIGGWLRVIIGGYFGVIFGQTIISLGQLPLLGAPPKLSATWFGANEWAFATSVGVLANQAGGAFAYLISPHAVTTTGSELSRYLVYQASACTAVFVLAFVFIPAKPPVPASHASVEAQRGKEGDTTWREFVRATRKDITAFLSSQSGLLLSLCYGIAVGVFYAISTLLEEIVRPIHVSGSTVGNAGFVMGVVGLFGSVAVGILLDRTKLYKHSLTALLFFSAVSVAALSLADATKSGAVLFLAIGSLGFFLTGVLPAGFEYAAEVSYPTPEDSVAVVLNISSQVFGILFIGGASVFSMSPQLIVWALAAALALGSAISAVIRGENKRQSAQECAALVAARQSKVSASADGSSVANIGGHVENNKSPLIPQNLEENSSI